MLVTPWWGGRAQRYRDETQVSSDGILGISDRYLLRGSGPCPMAGGHAAIGSRWRGGARADRLVVTPSSRDRSSAGHARQAEAPGACQRGRRRARCRYSSEIGTSPYNNLRDQLSINEQKQRIRDTLQAAPGDAGPGRTGVGACRRPGWRPARAVAGRGRKPLAVRTRRGSISPRRRGSHRAGSHRIGPGGGARAGSARAVGRGKARSDSGGCPNHCPRKCLR